VLPVENSTAGSINQAYDLLLDHDLRVWGEIIVRVRHALLAPRGAQIADLTRVRSHPQALAQCERYLTKHGWARETSYDTAGSARDLAASPEASGSDRQPAGRRTHGLEELDYGIEDSPHNYTRFFVLSLQDPPAHSGQDLIGLCRPPPTGACRLPG
jgi:prephenate dehydratase